MTKKYSLETDVVYVGHEDQFNASVPPLYQTATFKQESLSNMGEYDYTRSGNPTRTTLQQHLAKIMRAKSVFAVTSGMSAMDTISRLLNPGDEVIAGDDIYGGTHRLLVYLQKMSQIEVNNYDCTDTELLRSKITSKTKMIFLESPTNPLIKVIDVRAITSYAHKISPDCIVVFDNTMMSPILMNPLELGVDIHYESATKFLNGHHDIMAGVIATNSDALAEKIYFIINSIGCGLSPFDSWLLVRGLKTLALRVERQQENALKIAEWLESKNLRVRYPGLKSHKQYELHQSQARGPGAVLSFETGSVSTSEKIVEGCELFGVTVSFGCVNSLISLPCKMSHASIDEKTRNERALPEDLIRLCVGIESSRDLIEDLEQSLQKAGVI